MHIIKHILLFIAISIGAGATVSSPKVQKHVSTAKKIFKVVTIATLGLMGLTFAAAVLITLINNVK